MRDHKARPPCHQPVESFESCFDELEKVVKELEAGDLPLERSLELFEKGMALSETCRKQLENAETRVERFPRSCTIGAFGSNIRRSMCA